jgi:hypothetical protein
VIKDKTLIPQPLLPRREKGSRSTKLIFSSFNVFPVKLVSQSSNILSINQTALSRSCGDQPNSVRSIKTTRQLSKINPYVGRFGGRRNALQWGDWGASPPASTWLITRNLNLESPINTIPSKINSPAANPSAESATYKSNPTTTP